MRLGSVSLGFGAAAAALLAAGTASAEAPVNVKALGFASDELAQFEGSAKDNEKSGVSAQVVEVEAPVGEPGVHVAGAALNPAGEGLVALVWDLQTSNKLKRTKDRIKVDQKADVAFQLRLYASEEAFAAHVADCYSQFILLDSCQGDGKVDSKGGLSGKFSVKCKDVSASSAAAAFLSTSEGGGFLQCSDGTPSETDLTTLIGSFLDDKGKLDLRVKDVAGVLTDEGVVFPLDCCFFPIP